MWNRENNLLWVFVMTVQLAASGFCFGETDGQAILNQLQAPKGRIDKRAGDRLNVVERLEADYWVATCLAPHFQPPERSRFVFLPGVASNEIDRMVNRYEVDDKVAVLTVTKTVVAIQISHQTAGSLSLDSLDKLLSEVLVVPVVSDLRVVCELAGDQSHGCVSLQGAQTGTPAWLHTVRWWQEAGSVGLCFLKRFDRDAPGIEVGISLQENVEWFRSEVLHGKGPVYSHSRQTGPAKQIRDKEVARSADSEQSRECRRHLRAIEAMKEQFALENKLSRGAAVSMHDLQKYVQDLPKCPDGGQYDVGVVGTSPKCSVHGVQE